LGGPQLQDAPGINQLLGSSQTNNHAKTKKQKATWDSSESAIKSCIAELLKAIPNSIVTHNLLNRKLDCDVRFENWHERELVEQGGREMKCLQVQGADLTSASVGVERIEEVGRDESGQALAR
jgi:hypothetical protein